MVCIYLHVCIFQSYIILGLWIQQWIRQCGAGCKHDSHVILDYAVIIYKIELENRV